MNAHLVDSSVWIDFFNDGNNSPQRQKLKALLNSDAAIFICPAIYQEILHGIRDDRKFRQIKFFISDMEMLKTDLMTVTDHAVNIYRTLRKKGITIRKSQDCLIASYAMIENLALLHNDRDFDSISSVFTLNT
ncbi:MAG: PIN domain-containing protein [Chitinispirillia bacterium]|nr:PIN domain-containing protein [Chitinispirillia bacterium]MCL2269308.1 PIN domain-containing protein [Chitinispirillia bacterium]